MLDISDSSYCCRLSFFLFFFFIFLTFLSHYFTSPTQLPSLLRRTFQRLNISLSLSLQIYKPFSFSLSLRYRSHTKALRLSKMQSASFTLASPSPSLSLLKQRRQPPSLSFNPRFDPIRASSSSNLNNDSFNVNLSTRRSWSLSSSSSSSSPIKLRPWNAPLPSYSDAETNRFEVKATSVPEAAGEKPESSSLFKTLELGALFGLWYLFNIYFNIYNKQVRFRFDSFSKHLRLRICVCVCVFFFFGFVLWANVLLFDLVLSFEKMCCCLFWLLKIWGWGLWICVILIRFWVLKFVENLLLDRIGKEMKRKELKWAL